MGFIKLGAGVHNHIIKTAHNMSDLNLTREENKRIMRKIASGNNYILLHPDEFIYTRERAVSAFERYGLNGNYDGFTEEVLSSRYATFINSPRYIDHANSDPMKAIGIVLDAVYHPLSHPKGGWIETITARDKRKMSQVILSHLSGSPNLYTAVKEAIVTDVSMGCYVEKSVCTVCGNIANDVDQYCEHVTIRRGSRIKAADTSPVSPDNDGLVVAGELVYGVTFFELSDITSTEQIGGGGADVDAKILERVACNNNWECFIIDGLPDRIKKQNQKAHDICDCSGNNKRLIKLEGNEMGNKKGQTEVAPVADSENQSVIDRVTPDIDSEDEDKELSDQAKAESDKSDTQKITGPDSISQEGDSKDYPIKKAEGEADPDNEIGGKPRNVKEEEDEVRKEKFDNIKDKIDEEDVEEAEGEMEDDIESEEEINDEVTALSKELGSIFKRRFPKIVKTERFKEIQDHLDDLESIRKNAILNIKKARSAKKKKQYRSALRKVNARIEKYFEQFGGNLQELGPEDTSGDSTEENKELSDQAKGPSDSDEDTALIDEEDISQEADSPDYPQKGAGKIYVAADQSDEAIEEMLSIMQNQNKTWDEAWDLIKDKFNVPAPMKPMGASKIIHAFNAGDKVKYVSNRDTPYAKSGDVGVVDEGYTPATAGSNVPVKWNGGGFDIVSENEIEKVGVRKRAGKYNAGDKVKYVGNNPTPYAESGDAGIVDNAYTPGTAGDKVPVEWNKGGFDIVSESEIEKVGAKEDEAPETADADSSTDISQETKETDPEAAISDGTNDTLESPATDEITDPTELKQGKKLSPARARLRKLILGEDEGGNSQDNDLEIGTTDTKASPETDAVADEENIYQEKELEKETQGTTAPPPIVGKLDLFNRIVAKMQKKIDAYKKNDSFIRNQNEHLFKSLGAVKKRLKWIQSKKLALQMFDKGFFFIGEKGEERNVKQRRQAMHKAAKDMMLMTFAELEIKMATVNQAPSRERNVKSWNKEVITSGDGNVKEAVNQRATTDEEIAGPLFE